MKSSNNFLIKQFFDARINDQSICLDNNFEREFYKWLRQMQEISKYYTDFLEKMSFDFKESNCAEISKSFFDTIVKPFNTYIISLYENGLNDIGETRVIKGDLVVDNDNPAIVIPTMGRICYISNYFDTYITQNPYSQGDFKKLSLLHNTGNYKIVAGVFGFVDDKNKSKKISDLKKLRDSLYGDYDFDLENKDGVYYGALGTKKRIRK